MTGTALCCMIRCRKRVPKIHVKPSRIKNAAAEIDIIRMKNLSIYGMPAVIKYFLETGRQCAAFEFTLPVFEKSLPVISLIKKRAQLFDISLERFVDDRRAVVKIQNLRKLFRRFRAPQRKDVFVLMEKAERERNIRKHAAAQGLHRDKTHIALCA